MYGGSAKIKSNVSSGIFFNSFRLSPLISLLCKFVLIGWAIYPIGYWVGVGANADMANANLIYNYADFINKIAFGLAIYVAAVSDSE